MILGNFSAWVLQITLAFQPHSTSLQTPSSSSPFPSPFPTALFLHLSLHSAKAKSSLASVASLYPIPRQMPPLLKKKTMCYGFWKL